MSKVTVEAQAIYQKILFPSLLVTLAVSLLVGYSYFWNIDNIRNEQVKLALAEAKANWNKDAAFRQWATKHGGVYVKPNERTPVNPYLIHIENRDIVTEDGTQLTLMNPAYMMRQMTEEFESDYGIKGKITGKVQLNPVNKPDAWQLKVLNAFEAGSTDELFEQQLIEGLPYLRYMKAMYMTDGCVKCHGHLGFKDGDLRGGVSVSIPLTPYFTVAEATNSSIRTIHLVVWMLGMIAIAVFSLLMGQALSRLSQLSLHDALTKLPNTRLFKMRLDLSLKKYQRDNNTQFAVCFLDLDRFKNLNDSRGHSTGDLLLIALSSRLEGLLRPGDTISRMGGDEFTLLLDNIEHVNQAIEITQRVLASFEQPFLINNDEIYASTSVGICMVAPYYINGSDMIRDADIAMYRAKAAGPAQFDIFNPDMHSDAIEVMRIENDLRGAIERGELDVYYQPVIDIEKNTINGFEALLRWHHPEMGDIPPDRFIPIAEHTGLINGIGSWVLEQACNHVSIWNEKYNPEGSLSIAVNLSAMQLVSPSIHEIIDGVMRATKIGRENLHLEVTETMLLDKKELAKASIEKIRTLGISMSIDDFGTGYCSLTYLQEFEFDILKIDKDFVQNIESSKKGYQLVKALILMAKNLDLQVVAEGVETAEQLKELIELSCDYFQGYHYAQPLPSVEIEKLLAKGYHLQASKFVAN